MKSHTPTRIPVAIKLSAAQPSSEVGAKAFHLARAIAKGFNVPAGFVLSRQATRDFIAATDLRPALTRYLESAIIDPRQRAGEFERLCVRLRGAMIPEELMRSVEPFLQEQIAASPSGLAVRSSGAQEDSKVGSFAGIYHTTLSVRSPEKFWDAVRDCWCSAWSPTALDYAAKIGLKIEMDQMAVLVQSMLAADSAGVLFTVDPMTGDPWRFVINSTFGLAAELLNGKSCGERFVLEWDTGKVLEREVESNRPSLADAQLLEVATLGLALDETFDMRVDVEFVFEHSRLWLVQVRPVTALPPFFPCDLAIKGEWQRNATRYSLSPNNALVTPLFKDVWDVEKWQRHQPRDVVLCGPVDTYERDVNGYRYDSTRIGKHWFDFFPDWRHSEKWLAANERRFRDAWERTITITIDLIERDSMAAIRGTHSAAELIPAVLTTIDRAQDCESQMWSAPQSMGWMSGDVFDGFNKEYGLTDLDADMQLGLDSFPQRRTIAAQDLGRSIDEDFVRDAFGRMPVEELLPFLLQDHPQCRFLRNYDDFCRQFAMPPIAWWGRPTLWRFTFEPEVLALIRDAALGCAPDARANREALEARRFAAERAARERLTTQPAEIRTRFDRILDWVQYWSPVVNGRGVWFRAERWQHELIWETGLRLVREGLLERPEEVILLTPEDLSTIARLERAVEFAPRMRQRKHEYRANRRLDAPEKLNPLVPSLAEKTIPVSPEPENLAAPESEAENTIRGRGITPWTAEGTVRKSENPSKDDLLLTLQPADILVCKGESTEYYTDWQSLFLKAKGLVIAQRFFGLHHASQIARECGVAFLYLPEASFADIPEGARVRLDGPRGTLTLIDTRPKG